MKEQPLKRAHKERRKTKKTLIIEAAADLFLQHGYDGTSIDMIAERADVSRQTIYNQYESKETLFSAITAELLRNILLPLASSLNRQDGLRGTLTAFGRHLLKTMLSPRTVALYRLTITEAQRFPILGRVVYASGIEAAEKDFAAYLCAQRGLSVPDPYLAAQQFFALVTHPISLKVNLGFEIAPDEPEIENHLKAAVDTFLRAFAAA